MSQGLDEIEVRLTIEEDWEILKTVRLESLLDSPDVFSATYAIVEKYSESEWRDRAAHKTKYQYILAQFFGVYMNSPGSSVLRDTITVILAGGQGERLHPLTAVRSKPAVPFGGKYRIIDFALSNCLNSGFRRVYVLIIYIEFFL